MITYDKFYNGVGLSRTIQNAFDGLYNVDIHTEPGTIRPQKALAKESGTTITKGCYSAVVPSGDTYFFSKTDGAIFKRTAAGVYSSVRTNSNGAHKGAGYYRNKLYYATATTLGVFDLDSTWNDSYQTLTSADEHPIYQFDLIMYVGNDNDVAQLDDADVWSASGLDLPVEHSISALGSIGDDLITLSNPGSYINNSAITRWDTYSDSWSVKDSIKEIDAYAFLDADNYIYAICSTGNIYFYNGQQLELFSVIRSASSTSGHQLTANFKGKPLIANGGRIYSLHRASRDLPIALSCEFTCSAGSSATIHSLAVSGNNLLVAWEYSGTYGVDNISSNYAIAEIYTPVFMSGKRIEVPYFELPGSSSISIETRQDGASSYTSQTVEVDSTDKRVVRMANNLDIKNLCKAKITLTPDGVNYPVIPAINII